MNSKRPSYILNKSDVGNICDVGAEGVRIIEQTTFTSQRKYNPRRGIRIANIINDFFEPEDFAGKHIIELGPGHYAFALLARHLGAKVTCVERDPHFVKLGRYLGFQVIEKDFNDLNNDLPGVPFDGLWVKGTFNACNYRSNYEVEKFVERLTSLVKIDGWAWLTAVNKTKNGEAFLMDRINVQLHSFVKNGWMATPIEDDERVLYALNYSGSPNVYSRNLPASAIKERSATAIAVSPDNPFNRVQRIGKPTFEYFPNPWKYYLRFLEIVKHREGRFITMSQALAGDYESKRINVLLDHHIDFYPVETEVMCRWELENGVVSNVYLFNRFVYDDTAQRKTWSVEDLNIAFYQNLEANGFEIGYHQNALGLVRNSRVGRTYSREIDKADYYAAQKVFAEDIDNLRKYFNIRTFIPHGAGEGNAQLTELPIGYEDVVWVYNNAGRNGTCEPPLKWRNFSDSTGSAAQRLVGYRGQYVVQIDNLHLNAYLLSPGLNHVLVHPGRFAKGMPYELFDSQEKARVTVTVKRHEFSGVDRDLPLRTSQLIEEWASARGECLCKPFGGKRKRRCYYVISDDIQILQDHLGASDNVVPFLVHHRKMDEKEKLLYQVSRPTTSYFHLPAPKEEFADAFRKFYNDLYSRRVLYHLSNCGLPLDVIYLTDVTLERVKELVDLTNMLGRTPDDAAVYIRICVSTIARQEVEDNVGDFFCDTDVGRRFVCEVGEEEGNVRITIASRGESSAVQRRKHSSRALDSLKNGPVALFNMNLSAEELERFNRLCEARGEDADTVARRFDLEAIRKVPRRFSKHMNALRTMQFSEAGVRDGLAYVRLPNGRVFYGYTSRENHRRAYAYVCDSISSVITEDTYLLCLDIAQRYATNFAWPPKEILPPPGGTIVECGAYLGHKTVRFVDEVVGKKGKVLAIEMMPDNVEVLKRNIRENGLDKIVDVLESGVWSQSGALPVKGKGRQRNTLIETEQLNVDREVLARVDTLDAILHEWGQPFVDFMLMTINGAEIEALEGMAKSFDIIRAMFIAAPYEREGRPSSEICRELLLARGCQILESSRGGRLYATTPSFGRLGNAAT